MTTLSRHVAHATCAQIIHPWNDDCSRAYLMMIRSSAFGSCKVFVPIMLIDYALKLRKNKTLNAKMAREFLNDFIQSITMGTCISTALLVNSCVLRYILGKFTYTSVVFFPGFFAGFSYVVLKPKLRLQIFTAFANAALESISLKMSHSGLIKLNVYTETIFFMITNACLMYLSRSIKSNHSNYTWFYKPEVYDPDVSKKLHLETIFKNSNYASRLFLGHLLLLVDTFFSSANIHVFNACYVVAILNIFAYMEYISHVWPKQKTKNYFGLGVGFGVLRMLIGDVTVLAPKNLHKLFKMSTLKPGIFGASYVAAYELTVYFMNRHFGEDRPVSALPAGFLAGLSYAIEPNLSINLSAFINLIQLLCKLIDVRSLKHVSVDTILFCLFTGILFHVQMFYPKSISKVGSNFIRVTTKNKSTIIVDAMQKLMCRAI